MRIGPHSHPCQRCGTKTECCGDIEQNYDGWPEWVCVEFHMLNQHDFLCEQCQASVSTEGDTADDADSTEGTDGVGAPNILRGGELA